MAKQKAKSSSKKKPTHVGPGIPTSITGKQSPSFNIAQMTRKKKVKIKLS